MLLDKARYKFKLFLLALLAALVRSQIPGIGQLGGSTACSGCRKSYYCDMRCAPVTAGQSGPAIQRYCTQDNTNYGCCCGCTSNSADAGGQKNYFWYVYDNYTCASYCPGGYYPPTNNASGYACQKCNYQCNTCTGAGNNLCTTCSATAYQLGSSNCYGDMTLQYPALTSDLNPCPNGYYGVEITKICTACPAGTLVCAIHLTWEMPYPTTFASSYSMSATNCTGNGDPLCGYALKAFACNVGYTLVNGWCFPNTQCMLYSYYNANAGGSFSSANCLCFSGFEQQSAGSCLRCPVLCATCSGGACATCPTGASGATCGTYNGSFYQLQSWVGVTNIASRINCAGCSWTTNVAYPSNLVTQSQCKSSEYVFGYYGYYNQGVYSSALAGSYNTNLFPNGATLSYSNSGAFTGKNHYAVHIRATLLFIDSWTNGKSIAFTEGGLNRFEYYYKMEGIAGEFLCGYNTQDHLDTIDNTFDHTVDLLDLQIFATSNGLMWGIKEILIHAVLCDAMCTTCDGPSALQCLTCADATRQMVGGVCVCNSTADYYMAADNSGCVQNCTTSIMDAFSYSCVSTCNFPNYFIFTNTTTNERECLVNCPSGYFKKLAGGVYTCESDCYSTAAGAITTKYFNFNSTGNGPTCFNVCPSGTYGDPMTHSCVTKCSAYNSSTIDGYFGYNGYCYESCPSGWAYYPTRLCLSSCPTGYYKNFVMKSTTNSSICEQKCSVTLLGQFKYGDNTTGYCTSYCATGSYGDIATNLCLDVCNSTSYGQSITSGGVTQRLCVQNCTSNLYGNLFTGLCVNPSGCATNYYADPLTFICTLKCSGSTYFGDNKTCSTARCNGSYFRQNDSKVCVVGCFNNNSLLAPEWGDATSGYCVASCYGAYFGDPQKANNCTDTCSATPSPTFGLGNLCVLNCSNVTWADPYHPNRICTTSCTNTTADSYGYNTTRTCVLNCPDGEFAHNVSGVPLCVLGCTAITGLFGNILNNRCQAQCPSPYYGDVTGNRTCVLLCPAPYYASNCSLSGTTIIISPTLDRVCRSDCSSCGYADNSSRSCAWTSAGCMTGTYAHQSNNKCVYPTECTGFADPVSRNCVTTCINNSAVIYFGDPSTKRCVQICPLSPNLFGDNATRTCNLTCSGTYVRDWQYLRRCVNLNGCSRTPVALFGDSVKAQCVVALNCSDGYYGDNSTNVCKKWCPGSTLLYADNVTKQCVAQCSLGWYSLNMSAGKGVCSEYCPLGQWADNFTVKCTTRCSALTYGITINGSWTTFGTAYTQYGICENVCPDGMFARDLDNLCVYNCSVGGHTNIWGDTLTKTCVVSPFNCSKGYYADDLSAMCVVSLGCTVNGTQYVADNGTNKCVSKCPDVNALNASKTNYADMAKFLCVARCPPDFYGYNSTLKCVQKCTYPTNTTPDGSYADPQLNICVAICTSYPQSLFGENDNHTCVEARYCPANTWAEVVVYNRQCRPQCANFNTSGTGNAQQYSDNLTFSCVTECPTYSYADLSTGYGVCVYVCPYLISGPNGTIYTRQFADNSTKKCVTVCPSNQSTFGDNTTRSCVITCPAGSFAQQVPYRYCVAVCSTGTWGETIKNTCVTSPLMCPTVNGSMYYADNISTMCVKKCPGPTNTTNGSWGENTTQACLESCVLPSGQSGFEWNLTRVCINICPAAIGDDGSYSDQGMCFFTCMTNYTYRDPQKNRSCQTTCSYSPVKQYADDTTYRCVPVCPSYPQLYYADDNTSKCVATCPNSYRKLVSNRSCVALCPNTTYFDPNTYQCVATCPLNPSNNVTLFGDPTNTTQKHCVTNSHCPSNYYADSLVGLCVSNCSGGQWISGYDCVLVCPSGYYGNPVSMACVLPSGCPTNYFADNASVSCVAQCPGSFGFYNKTCLLVCPIIGTVKYYADPVTRLCSTGCTFNSTIKLYMNDLNQTCVSQCSPNLFLDPLTFNCTPTCSGGYYSDNSTRTCVSVCPAAPPLFGENKTYTCVQQCLNVSQFQYVLSRMCVYPCPTGYYMENYTRNCVTRCPNLTYADASGYCVANCSTKFAYDGTNTCETMCPEPYFADPTTYLCLFSCPNYPQPYFQLVLGNSRTCQTGCPTGQFRDFTSYVCTLHCPVSPPTFADTTSGSCLSICSSGYYANNATRVCMSPCPQHMFADPNTRTCVAKCDPSLGFYGDSNIGTPACVEVCSSGRYADDYTQTCVANCRNFPKMYGYDNGENGTTNISIIRQCVYSCPYPWVADNATGRCYLQCDHAAYPYLDLASKSCVSNCSSILYHFAYMPLGQSTKGQCVQYCPKVGSVTFFALRKNNTCVTKCPDGLFGSTVNNSCEATCNLGDSFYADPATNLCTLTCTSNGSYYSYADEFSRKCVTACPTDKGTVGDRQIWKCVKRCSNLSQFADLVNGYCVDQCPPGYFADNTTQTCISNCSINTLMYGDIVSRVCVPQCSLTNHLYADDSKRLCVNATNCSAGLFGFNTSRVCVSICPTTPNLFGDPVSRTCVYVCVNGSTVYFADPVSRTCVPICPAIPALFARNDSQTCVDSCPAHSYADNYTRYCIAVCSIVGVQTFADNTTNLCVEKCPTEPNYYASNYTWECVYFCPSSPAMYADNSTRSCVYYCPAGVVNTYADDSTGRCVDKCPNATYNENSTRQCLANCLTGFADPNSKYCIGVCPNYWYADNSTNSCAQGCPIVSGQQTYAEDGNNYCMANCLLFFKTYADPYTKRCVKVCPISQGYFADGSNINNRTCLAQCSPGYYADYSTRTCVPVCPALPALFAINNSRVCTAVCPNNSWADNSSRYCLAACTYTNDTYGENSTWSCVSICPTKPNTYADYSTHLCVTTCPRVPDLYADNITRRCISLCPNHTYADPNSRRCLTTCPDGWFGQNSSRRCVTACPWREFADSLLHLCVAKCSPDPIFYGNPDTLICVPVCPQVNSSFGNPLSQECVNGFTNGTFNLSGCPVAYFSDIVSRLCVQVCPMGNDTYGDNSTWKCVAQCPAGTVNTFADNSTMRCVSICPSYPDYYAQPFSRRCVHYCLAPNGTFSGSFSDNHTRTCTQRCPSTPDYYSDNSTGRCVFFCSKSFGSNLTFADAYTRRCVDVCPANQSTFGDPLTLRCVSRCPQNQSTFADPVSQRCVLTCPASPPLYADNFTQACISVCLYNGSFADNHTRRCVAVCPRYPDTYGDYSTNSCVLICPRTPDLYADPITQNCVPLCNLGFFAENTTRRCLDECPTDLINWADDQTRRCVLRCPANVLTYGDNQTQRCVTQCPLDPFTFADNITQTCVKICNNESAGGFGDNSSRICVSNCPDGSYGDITTRYCVRYCPVGWYAYTIGNLCVRYCPSPYFADNSTWKCVQQCPIGQNLFGQTINNTCVPICPNGTYASDQNQRCVTRCPNSTQTTLHYDTFGENTTHRCVDECPVPLYGYPVAQVCVDVCPDPYYENITDHRCYACPVECATCNAPYLCLTCNINHYLYAGACVESCPTFPVITYANPNRVCGTAAQCTQGYYALNATKSCVATCPAGHFVDVAGQSCAACMKGCVSCMSTSSCLACNIQLATWSNYTCYMYCSVTRKYYTAKGCVSSCPAGTYLSLTTCQSCSAVCKTCQVTAENCLVCANGYYRSNGICVSQCPSGTIAQVVNSSQTCVSCSVVSCKSAPLTFTTSQFMNNYQYNVQVQFSEPVNITQEIDKVIQIQQSKKKRLLATTYQYLDYTIIDYGNGLYTFVLNNYDPASGSSIEVQITNPSAIRSASGQMPQTTRSSLQVDTSSLYSLDYYNSSVDGYLYAVAVMAFVLLLFTFGTQQSIWMPMFDLLQLLMSLILVNVVFPPNLLYSIRSCFVSAFTFLPNFFSRSFSQAAFDRASNNDNIYSLMQDGSFLRVLGPLYFILLVTIVVLLAIWVLSKRCWNKEVKTWAKAFVRQTFWKKHLHGLVYLLFLPTMMLGLYDMSIYGYLGTSAIQIFSILSSFIFMLLFLVIVVYFAYRLRRLAKDYPIAYLMIQKAYNFVLFQKRVLVRNKNHYFGFEKNEVDLTDLREPRINELLVFPYPIETTTMPMQLAFPLVSYLHKFLTAVFLAVAFGNPVIQVILLILVNIAYAVYLIAKKPFFSVVKREFNNEIYIHNVVVVCLIEVVLLVLVLMYSQLDAPSRVLIGNVICGLILYVATVNLVYLIHRTYLFYYQNLWKHFVRSELFRLNYVIEHIEWTKDYQKQEDKLMAEVKTRAEFLEAIKVENGQALANMVMREPSIAASTKEKMKALQLRPNKASTVSKEYGQLFTHIANDKEKSQKSLASSERMTKNDRKKVRDTIFGQKEASVNEIDDYKRLELIDEKGELQANQMEVSQVEEDKQTEYEYQYIDEEYPEGTPMEEIMKGCARGDVVLPM